MFADDLVLSNAFFKVYEVVIHDLLVLKMLLYTDFYSLKGFFIENDDAVKSIFLMMRQYLLRLNKFSHYHCRCHHQSLCCDFFSYYFQIVLKENNRLCLR